MNKFEVQASCKATYFFIKEICKATGITAQGSTPTAQRNDVIKKLKNVIQNLENVIQNLEIKYSNSNISKQQNNFLQKLITDSYDAGARRGVSEFRRILFEKRILDADSYAKLPDNIKFKAKRLYQNMEGNNEIFSGEFSIPKPPRPLRMVVPLTPSPIKRLPNRSKPK